MSTSANNHILCPGQGAQTVGMGADYYAKFPLVRDLFDSAGRILGFDLASVCFNGPIERLSQTDVSQPAIFVASVASFRAAVETGALKTDAITHYAGLSLGEYTALHLAGVFDFEQGLRLVSARGRFMQQAANATPGGMVAILGAEADAVDKLCADAAQGEVLVPANYNAPGQIVLSGATGACQRALALAESAGMKATPLNVAGAFHSPLMQPAADRMREELARLQFQPPRAIVCSNVTAQPHADSESIKDFLVRQIVQPVRWEQIMRTILARVEPRLIELAPGRTLAGLTKRINRRVPVESLDTVAQLESLK